MRRNTVRIESSSQGTGFFISRGGTLLTCFHVIGDVATGEVMDEKPQVIFNDTRHEARVVRLSPLPSILDVAVLQLTDERLPEGATLFPLATWKQDWRQSRFVSFGFRPPEVSEGLFAMGEVSGQIKMKSGACVLQFRSQPEDVQQIRPGMSGAPVVLEDTGQIVGMVVFTIEDPSKESIPCAIPLDEIARFWPPLEKCLQEEDLLQQLLRVFTSSDWFTEATFRSFYEMLPITALKQHRDLGDSPPSELINQIRDRSNVYDLINCIRERRPDIPLAQLIDLPERRMYFVNRQYELEESCRKSAPQYLLFKAPPGYGKTELLKALERRHFRDNWLCLRTAVTKDGGSARRVGAQIGRALRCQDADDLPEGEAGGYVLAGIIKERVQTLHAEGVVLMVDSVEHLSPEEIDLFLNHFLAALQTGMGSAKLRIRLAGRYVDPAWTDHTAEFTVVVRSLTPFRIRYIRETLENMSPEQEELDLRAAYLMDLTGGHPGCMAEILKNMSFDHPVEQAFADKQPLFQQITLETADRVRQAIPETLRDVFDVLSLFRRYTSRLLECILAQGLLEYKGNAYRLEEEMTPTYLVGRRNGFIQDEIVRRVLTVRLRSKDQDRFLDLCRSAVEIYEEELKRGSQRPEVLIAEALYQAIRLGYYAGDQSLAARQALHADFFRAGGILDHYLGYITSHRDPYDVKQNFLALLKDDQHGDHGDWELRFSLNFFLRDSDYTDAPYKRLWKRASSLSIS